jgi:hypothetical protein
MWGMRLTRWSSIIVTLLPVAHFLAGAQVCQAECAGGSVSVTVGYLSALGNHNTISVQGITPTFASDNIFVGATVEAPQLWKAFYPLVATKWFFGNRYSIDEQIENHIGTNGVFVYGGVGYGLDAWQATLRLQAAAGYWWEDVNVDYSGFFRLDSFNVANDQVALLLAASLAFPFTGRVRALISCEFLSRPEEEISGSFENGRWYLIQTNGTFGTVSIGLAMGLGSR